MNIFNQINQVGMKNLISLKAIALFVSMLACSVTFSGCSDEDSDSIQAEVVFADDVNLTIINQGEFSIELEQGYSIIPFEIKSNSEWEISFLFENDNTFCFAYPNKGKGNATVHLCVNKNSSDERCTGKMHVVFPEGSTKSKIAHLSQKGNIDNDENFEYEEWDYYHFECPWCGNDIPILWDDLLDSEKQDSIITCNLCELFEKTIHEVLWAKHGWDDL